MYQIILNMHICFSILNLCLGVGRCQQKIGTKQHKTEKNLLCLNGWRGKEKEAKINEEREENKEKKKREKNK